MFYSSNVVCKISQRGADRILQNTVCTSANCTYSKNGTFYNNMTVVGHEPPNGGWGWMVVGGVAFINLFNQPLWSVFSLIFGDTLREMTNGKATGITLVMSIHIVVGNFSGLLVKPLLKIISKRYLTIIGVSLVGFGMIASSFATKLWHIAFSYGIFVGMGLGLLMASTFLVINDYFTTKKSIAVGVSMAGTSIGQMIMPLVVGGLLKKYKYSGTTLILGFFSLTGAIGAFLFEARSENKHEQIALEEIIKENKTYDLLKKNHLEEHTKALLTDNTTKQIPNESASTEEIPKSHLVARKGCIQSLVQNLDLYLLKEYKYVSMFVGLAVAYFSTVSFSTFFPLFLKIDAKFDMLQTTTCMTALSTADIMGRLTSPPIFKKFNISCRMQFMVGCGLLALFRFLLTTTAHYHLMLVYSFCSGYFRAISVINQNLVVSEAVTETQLPSAVGIFMVLKGIMIMSMGQPLGLIKDAFDYDLCINILNGILVIVVIWWCLDIVFYRKKKADDRECEQK